MIGGRAADAGTGGIYYGLFSNNIQYAGGFIEQEDGPVMIAMLDGIVKTGLSFHLLMGESAVRKKEHPAGCSFLLFYSFASSASSV